jgi:hypothetical protein
MGDELLDIIPDRRGPYQSRSETPDRLRASMSRNRSNMANEMRKTWSLLVEPHLFDTTLSCIVDSFGRYTGFVAFCHNFSSSEPAPDRVGKGESVSHQTREYRS